MTLRGVAAEGTTLSERRASLAGDPEGIMVLDGHSDDLPPGTPVAEVLPISDTR